MLLADRGYDADWIRELAMVERFFNRIKQCRRVATRYDKLAANYLAFVQLASIRLWLAAG
jgi:transposase